MKIDIYTPPAYYTPNFGSHEHKPLPKIEQDSFSILDKFMEKYRCGCKETIILDLKEYIKNSNTLKESDIKGISGNGGLSIVFDLGENEVLKCSLENPLEFRKHNPEFDIPFLSPVKKSNQTYIVRQAKAATQDITRKDCRDVIERILNAGFELTDDMDEYRINQVGKYNGKTYLLDTRCARPRPNVFSRYIYDFCQKHKRVFLPNKILSLEEENQLVKKFGPQIIHIDEAPRKNLSLFKGLSMMFEVMKNNMKYRGWPL